MFEPGSCYFMHDFARNSVAPEADRILVDMISKANGLKTVVPTLGANNTTEHVFRELVGRGQSYHWSFYRGTPASRSTRTEVREPLTSREAKAIIDARYLTRESKAARYRLEETEQHILGMADNETFEAYYGTRAEDPRSILGLAPRYSSKAGPRRDQIIDAGGTGNALTSIWVVVPGPRTFHWIHHPMVGAVPRRSIAAMPTEVPDENGLFFPAFIDRYEHDYGIAVVDPRQVIRICNIDTQVLKAPDAGLSQIKLYNLVLKGILALHDRTQGTPAILCNKLVCGALVAQMYTQVNAERPVIADMRGSVAPAVVNGVLVYEDENIMNAETVVA